MDRSSANQGNGKNGWERRLAAYMAAGGAVLAAKDAQATPIYVDLPDITIGIDELVDFDLNGDSLVDYQFQNRLLPGFLIPCDPDDLDCVPFPVKDERVLELLSGTNQAAGVGNPAALEAGVDVASQPFASFNPGYMAGLKDKKGGKDSGDWFGVSNKYLGLRFAIGSDTHYGWARLSVSNSTDIETAVTATLHDWAYESVAGASILTGQTEAAAAEVVPEPSSLTLLALGAAGLARYRRRRNSASR